MVRMRDRIVHRGPDAEGLFLSDDAHLALAFRRLAIIDLSPSGDQPMSTPDGSHTIVFNGEIFNFAELRSELEKDGVEFRSHGDTEVILRSYQRYGPSCVEQFHGMFAFAIWDRSQRSLFLARDRFGIKPLYYYFDGAHFIFSSELKAIVEHPSVAREIDPDALDDYLTYGYVPHDRAIFKKVRKLPAGHLLHFRDGDITVERYWELDYAPQQRSEDQMVDELRQRIADAVSLWSVSDVPVGVFLSGGLDSSAVCAMASHNRESAVQTFSIGFDYERQNELGYASVVANAFGTDHSEKLVRVEDAVSVLSLLASIYDEPFYDTSAVPTYYVSKFAAEHVKVVLAGDGGDELFFGYNWYERQLQLERDRKGIYAMPGMTGALSGLRRLPWGARLASFEKRTTADAMHRYFRLIGFFDEYEKGKLLGDSLSGQSKDPLWLYRKFYRSDLPPVTALRLLDVNTYMVDDILTKVDRASMANSLEVRTPLLEHSLAEFIMTIPAENIYGNGDKKHMFKRSMTGVLPDEIINRRKSGFSAPIRSWLRGDLAAVARERLLNGYAVRDGVLNPKAIQAMMRNFTENRWAKLWSLLMFEGWYRRWIHGVDELEPMQEATSTAHV